MDGVAFASAYDPWVGPDPVSLPPADLDDGDKGNPPAANNALDSNRVAEFWTMLGAAKFVTIVQLLAAELRAAPTEIRHLAGSKKGVGRARSLAHNLRTISDNFGATGVARAAEAVELARLGADLDHALAQLDRQSALAHAALLDLLATPSTAAHRFV